MNTTLTLAYWGHTLVWLAFAGAVLVGVAEVSQRLTRSAVARRTIWRTELMGLMLITMAETTGLSQLVTFWISLSPTAVMGRAQPPAQDPPPNAVQKLPPAASHSPWYMKSQPVRGTSDISLPTSRASTADEMRALPVWWPGWIWLAGSGLLAARVLVRRSRFWLLQCGHSGASPPSALTAQVRDWARGMGMRRPIRVTFMRHLTSPIAFGVWRPSIGLPEHWCDQFTPSQQGVMLLHELAHLRSHDPPWRWLADLIVMGLWWNPAAWWARRQLLQATEMAADEASLFIEQGPDILAECLVELGRRMHHPSPAAWLGIHGSGFRSNLGRRVSRLVHLNDQGSLQRLGVLRRLGIVLSLTGVSLLTVLGTASLVPQGFAAGNSAGQPLTESWHHSVVGLAFAAVWTPAEDPDSLARGTSPSTHDATRSSQANETIGAVGGPNEGQTEVSIEVQFAGVPEHLVEDILGPWLKTNAVNDLNSQQARELFKTLSKRPEVVVISAPNVTRPTDRQITYSIAVRGPTPTNSAPAESVPFTNFSDFASTLSLDVIPFVTTNGQAVRLTLTPSLLEFTGYGDWAEYKAIRAEASSRLQNRVLPLPRFHAHCADPSSPTLSDEHTAVIGWLLPDGFSLRPGEISVRASDGSTLGQPVRGDDDARRLIAVGNRSSNAASGKHPRSLNRTKVFMFVTPRIVKRSFTVAPQESPAPLVINAAEIVHESELVISGSREAPEEVWFYFKSWPPREVYALWFDAVRNQRQVQILDGTNLVAEGRVAGITTCRKSEKETLFGLVLKFSSIEAAERAATAMREDLPTYIRRYMRGYMGYRRNWII